MAIEKHHVLYPKRIWRANKETQDIRSNTWLLPALDSDVHNDLHREVAAVPTPPFNMARFILKEFVPIKDDYVATVHSLMGTIEEAIHHPRVRTIEYQLGDLIIHSLEAQLPYIKEGLR